MLWKVSVFTAIVLLMSPVQAVKPSFKNPPSDTIGAKDHDVTMYCQVAHKGKSNVYWHCLSDIGHQDVTVGPNVNRNSALKRFVIDNSGASVGHYNLVVANATVADSGKCSCIIDTGIGNAMEAGARLTVVNNITAPKNLLCTINKPMTPGQKMRVFTDEDDIQLICQSRNGVPLANIHWEIVRAGSNGQGLRIFSSLSTTETVITAIADYTITPADNGAYFQCIHSHVTITESSMCSPKFRKNRKTFEIGSPDEPIVVKYRPVLRFIPSTLKVTPFETMKETLRCVYDANPDLDANGGPSIQPAPVLKWNYTKTGTEDSIDLTLDQSDNGEIIECVATNELGSSKITLKIESTGFLPSWILMLFIGGGGLIVFFIIAVACSICFAGGGDDDKDGDDATRSQQDSFERNGDDMEEHPYVDPEAEAPDMQELDAEMIDIDEFMFDGGDMTRDYDGYGGGYTDDIDIDIDFDDEAELKSSSKKIKKKASSNKYDKLPMHKV